MLKVCNATEKQVWEMINYRMNSRQDCWKAMKFIEEHNFPNVNDPENEIFDSWMQALSYRANREFRGY